MELARARVSALVAPRNVVLVGASDRPGSWSARVWRNLNRYGFAAPVYLVNPRAQTIWDRPCYRDIASLPDKPDHLVILVPAAHVADVLREGAAAGARSATIFSSGFGEAFDEAGATLGEELRRAIAETGLAVSGPNCMGNICAPASFVTLTEDRTLQTTGTRVALAGQSGGVMIFVNQALEERGLAPAWLITTGNEAGLTIADYIAFFASEPEIRVILVYVESLRDRDGFRAACLHARAQGKSVVAIKLGQSEAGRSAALAHTGVLAGSLEAFDALAADIGVIRADTLDDAVELTEYLAHAKAPDGLRLGAITLSGAYRGLLLDAAERNGLTFPELAPETLECLNSLIGVGSLVSNPIDGGFGVLTSESAYVGCIEALAADPSIDMVLLQEALPRAPGSDRAEKYIRRVEEHVTRQTQKPVAFVTLASHGQSDYSRNLRLDAAHVPFLQEANKALRTIGAAARAAHRLRIGAEPAPQMPDDPARGPLIAQVRAFAECGRTALDESETKALLGVFGIAAPLETIARTREAAIAAAAAIGYPTVFKGIASTLHHKSDAGAVRLGISDATAAGAAWDSVCANMTAAGHQAEGVLVAQQIGEGVDLVIGAHRDPECGWVLMAGAGGVLIELMKDVAFAALPLNQAKARDMLARLRVSALLQGYRSAGEISREPAVEALLGVAAIVEQLSQDIQSIEINPFRLTAKGGFALDGLTILCPPA